MSETNNKGDIGEAAFILESTKKGYFVAKMPQNCPYDCVLDRGSGPERVQVKYRTLSKNGTISIHKVNMSRSSKRAYSVNVVDYFAVYIPNVDKVYLISAAEVLKNNMSVFRLNSTRNNQIKNVKYITEYEIW